MPQFKTTHNIFKDFGDEVWHDNNMDSDTVVLPPSPDWSYDRVMDVEDVEIWEVIVERGGGIAVYAAWMTMGRINIDIIVYVDPGVRNYMILIFR